MCNIVFLNGEEIETASELISAGFELIPDKNYGEIDPKCCLCQVDLKKTFEKNGVAYKENGMYWELDHQGPGFNSNNTQNN